MELLSTLIGLQLFAINPVFGELLWGRRIPFLTQPRSLITSTAKVQSSEILTSRLPPVAVSVPEIARQVTVRILTEPGLGSGVIIDRQGQTYTVLTCYHVVEIAITTNTQFLPQTVNPIMLNGCGLFSFQT